MARLATAGFEWGELLNSEVLTYSATSPTINNTNPRTGSFAMQCTSTAVATYAIVSINTVTATVTAYLQASFKVTALPPAGTTITLMNYLTGAGGNQSSVVLTETGAVRLAGSGGAQIGSDSAATVAAGAYFVLEFSIKVDTANAANAFTELRLNGTSVASGSGIGNATTVPQTCRVGAVAQSGAAIATVVPVYVDDIILNDSTGANENSWPGSQKVVLLKPISLNTNGGSWTDSAAATTSAALTDAIDNTPPTGIADTTASAGHQDRNAAANSSLDMNLTTYTTGGIGASDTVNAVEPMVNVGAPVVTAAKTGSFGISSNPVIANRVFTGGGTAAANFWRGVTAGSYPTGWGWERGTLTYAPTVTLGSSPVARVTITGGTTTRIAMVDAMGLLVSYTPAAPATKSPPFQARTARNMLLRR